MKRYKRNLDEGLSIIDDKLVFDYSNDSGLRVALGTKQFKFKPYKTKVDDYSIISLYQVTSEDKVILRTLKNETSIQVDKKDLDYFADRSALYAFQQIPEEIDIILFSENSYYLFDSFIKKLESRFSSKVITISQSIYKTTTDNLKIKDDAPIKYLKDLQILLTSLKKKDTIKLRNDIPLKFRKYFTGFISIRNGVQFENKNILIVDDILTTGSTFLELFEVLKIRGASNIYGLTLFKFR